MKILSIVLVSFCLAAQTPASLAPEIAHDKAQIMLAANRIRRAALPIPGQAVRSFADVWPTTGPAVRQSLTALSVKIAAKGIVPDPALASYLAGREPLSIADLTDLVDALDRTFSASGK